MLRYSIYLIFLNHILQICSKYEFALLGANNVYKEIMTDMKENKTVNFNLKAKVAMQCQGYPATQQQLEQAF